MLKYGYERRTEIIEREAAQAIDETSLIPNEPGQPRALSTGGFVALGEGHDIEPARSPTRCGDAFHRMPLSRSRRCSSTAPDAPTVPAHSLPSARGHGEPLLRRLDPPDGAVRRRDDRRTRGPVAAGERRRLRLHRAPKGPRTSPSGSLRSRAERAREGARAGARAGAERGFSRGGHQQRGQAPRLPGREIPEMRTPRAISSTTFRGKRARAHPAARDGGWWFRPPKASACSASSRKRRSAGTRKHTARGGGRVSVLLLQRRLQQIDRMEGSHRRPFFTCTACGRMAQPAGGRAGPGPGDGPPTRFGVRLGGFDKDHRSIGAGPPASRPVGRAGGDAPRRRRRKRCRGRSHARRLACPGKRSRARRCSLICACRPPASSPAARATCRRAPSRQIRRPITGCRCPWGAVSWICRDFASAVASVRGVHAAVLPRCRTTRRGFFATGGLPHSRCRRSNRSSRS